MRSVTQDASGAAICGVARRASHARPSPFGSAIVAVAGVLYALNYPVNPYEGFGLTVKAFTIIILGGIGKPAGRAARRHLPRRRRSAHRLLLDVRLGAGLSIMLLLAILMVFPHGLRSGEAA